MTVEKFRQVFLRLCKDHHIEPQENVLNALSRYVNVTEVAIVLVFYL